MLKLVIDLLLSPLALTGAIASAAVSRWISKLPLCTFIFDRFRVYPIRHHYYSPLVYQTDLRRPLAHRRMINGLDLNEEGQLDLVEKFDFKDELIGIPNLAASSLEFGYKNVNFGPGDAEYLYNMIRYFKPKIILEIGCGYSTLIARQAVEVNKRKTASYTCDQICIEPYEHPWLDELGVNVRRTKIEDIDGAIVDTLMGNDILFIDSSHIIRPQGDVLHEYLHLLGRVRPGVLIHVHDIFTPHDYPGEWVVRHRRLWNEQYLLEAFLCFNDAFKIIAAVNWLWHCHPHRLERACPVLLAQGGEPGSFWFTRVK